MTGRTRLLVIVALCNELFCDAYTSTVFDDLQPGDSCEMGGGVTGTCEEIGKCLEGGGIVRREGQLKVCGMQFSNIYVCCRRPHLVAKELCDAWSHYWRSDDNGCATEHPLIVGGTTANVGEFPYAVLVGRQFGKRDIDYECGGTLLSPHFVLTAAHCLYSHVQGLTYWVKLGEHDVGHNASADTIESLVGPLPPSLYGSEVLTASMDDGTAGTVAVKQIIEVEEEFIYPMYSPRYYYHDIALLKLKNPAKLSKRVLPACLPHQYPPNDNIGEKLTVVGWGRTAGSREMSRTLQKVEVPVVDRLSCSITRANTRKTPAGITEDMICAGQKGKDSCGGDSGGPLSTQIPRNSSSCEHTIVGVVSYGIGSNYFNCGTLGVYTRVSSYLDWITGYIAPKGTTYSPTDETELAVYNDTKTADRTHDASSTSNVLKGLNVRARNNAAVSPAQSRFLQENETTEPPQKTTTASTTTYNPPIIFGNMFDSGHSDRSPEEIWRLLLDAS